MEDRPRKEVVQAIPFAPLPLQPRRLAERDSSASSSQYPPCICASPSYVSTLQDVHVTCLSRLRRPRPTDCVLDPLPDTPPQLPCAIPDSLGDLRYLPHLEARAGVASACPEQT